MFASTRVSVNGTTAQAASAGPIDSTWTYAPATGFLLSRTVAGVTHTFQPRPDGNVHGVTDALGHQTVLDYAWGQSTRDAYIEEIKKAMKSEEYWLFSFLGRSGTLRTEELREDVETIKNLYYNKGYIQVQVDEPIIKPKRPAANRGPRRVTSRAHSARRAGAM